MRIAMLYICDIANGPGVRTSVFVSGCRRHCPGCHNEEAQSFDYGVLYTSEIEKKIIDSLSPEWVEGVSYLGGEPFEKENAEGLIRLSKAIRERYPNKSIWVWSGYLYEALKGQELLSLCDVLVDGPYIEAERDLTLAFRGSRNQRIIDLSKGTLWQKST